MDRKKGSPAFGGEINADALAAYRVPNDAPVVIQFSGGRTSAYLLAHILAAHGGTLPENALVLFQNTGREMPETLDFVHRCGVEWGVHIVWIEFDPAEEGGFRVVSHNSAARNGEPFEALIRSRKYLPARVMRFCTTELKIRPAVSYLKSVGLSSWHTAIGLRADEMRRVRRIEERISSGKDGSQELSPFLPLVAAGVSRRDVSAWWSRQAFNLELEDIAGRTPLGNCDGCFLKSEKSLAWLARYRPDRAAWWRDMEALAVDLGRDTSCRFSPRFSWGELIEHAARQPDWVFSEEAGVYCEQGLGGCHD